jgi:DNA helicase-2/ATP-dependent DNA helicase PcrA
MEETDILKGLNEAQEAAVVNYEGPSLIVAGAGSGKTRVLTARIAYMIARGVPPHTILALTFTNKAAAEMRERIEGMVGGASRYIQMGTFHSVFLRILRAEAEKIGYPPAFTIYDTTDSVNLVKTICKELSLADNEKYKPRNIFSKISRLKNDLVTPAAYEEDSSFMAEDLKKGQGQFLEIYRRYTARCKANGAMDFDDLLLNMVVLFKGHADVLAKYRDRFRYILVDEYQDTNHVQYLIVKALAMTRGNICVVGDDSQSIYSFRGARIENILGFKRDFPGARVYKLEQNYRSTQTIVSAANGVIARNASSRTLKKECFSAGQQGGPIKLLKAYTDREEAEMVASELRQLGRGDAAWDDIAVLYRVNALSRSLEEALRRRDIPYKIYRGHSFFDRKEIKDLLGYFRLIVNPRDDEAFRRVVNYPARGIGEVTLGRLSAAARQEGVSLWEAASGSDDRKIRGFMELVHSLALLRAETSLYEFGREVATRTGIIGGYKTDGSSEAISALENIEELLNSMVAGVGTNEDDEAVVQTLEDWLGNVALMTDMDSDEPENRNKVTLMTVHSAKGLEFRHVFIVGLEEELFPSVRDGDGDEIEEERRLFYVALTRAKEQAFLSMAEMRFIHGNMAFRRPSRFVREIDSRFLDGSLSDERPSSGFGDGDRPVWEARKPDPAGWAKARGAESSSDRRLKPTAGFHRREPTREVAPVAPDSRFRKLPSSSRPADGMADSDFAPGTRVAHAKFGPGTVNDAEPMAGAAGPADLKITVTFDDPAHGRKTLLSKFAKLEII